MWKEEQMKKQKPLTLLIFLGPMLLIFLGLNVYPIVKTVAMSFFHIKGITDPVSKWKFTGLWNYNKLLHTSLFQRSLLNMGKIWLYGGLAIITLSLLFAVMLTRNIRFKRFFKTVIYLPYIVSAVALSAMWLQYVYNPQFGLLKKLFTALHLDGLASTPWTDADHKFMSMMVAYCFGMIGYFMLIWFSGITRISLELKEAARIDGASRLQADRYITLPLLKGIFKTILTMWTISVAGFFTWSQLFSTDGAELSTITPTVYMYSLIYGTGGTTDDRQAGMGAAVGIILSICTVIVFMLCNRLIKEEDLEM